MLRIDTEMACLSGPPNVPVTKRMEHGPLEWSVQRAKALVDGWSLARTHYVLTLRRGTDRAVSHWAHCMHELSQSAERLRCSLGNLDLAPFKKNIDPMRLVQAHATVMSKRVVGEEG